MAGLKKFSNKQIIDEFFARDLHEDIDDSELDKIKDWHDLVEEKDCDKTHLEDCDTSELLGDVSKIYEDKCISREEILDVMNPSIKDQRWQELMDWVKEHKNFDEICILFNQKF